MNKEQIRVLFEQFDIDKDKYLSYEEFAKVIYNHFNVRNDSEELDELTNDLFTLADGNGTFNRKDGKLNFTEYMKCIEQMRYE